MKVDENDIAFAGCMVLLGEAMVCIAIGGFFGWPVGLVIFGGTLLIQAHRHMRKLKKGTP